MTRAHGLDAVYRASAMNLGPARRMAAWERHRRTAEVVDALGDDLLVLDVGCGTGPTARLLAARHRIVGVDLDPRPLEAFSRFGLAVAADAGALPFEDATFDAVVSSQSLTDMPLDSALAEVARVLRPGGHLVVEQGTVVDASVWPQLAYWRLRRLLPGRFRLRFYSRRRLRGRLDAALAQHGFTVLRREGLEISTGPFYRRGRARRFALVAAELPRLASQELLVARRA